MDEKVKKSQDIVQYCTFRVGKDFFGINVLDVQEVIKPLPLTSVPQSTGEICGLMNLRGNIVTQISLRQLFKSSGDDPEDHMNIIVESHDGLLALKVDEIDEVYQLDDSCYESPPESLNENLKAYVSGINKMEDRLMVLLDLDKLFNTNGQA